MRVAVFVCSLAYTVPSGAADVATLVCKGKTAQGLPLMDVVLQLDLDKRTVDGAPATIDESQIKWDRARVRQGKVEYESHALNRITGSYQWLVEGVSYAGPPPVYKCEKASAPKF